MNTEPIKIAFAGQPNCGKSTLFNSLTGAMQHVANYPGITVEKKTGEYYAFARKVTITDLPGTYSLTSYSPEERVSRNFILYEKPELVVNVVDGSSLERQLYLSFQLLEMNRPMVLYLNKMDIAEHSGLCIDIEKLSNILGVPIVQGSARKNKGTKELQKQIIKTADDIKAGQTQNQYNLEYGSDMEDCISKIVCALEKRKKLQEDGSSFCTVPLRWLSVKLCEKDKFVIEDEKENFNDFDSVINLIENLNAEYTKKNKHSFEVEIALARASAAKKIIAECVQSRVPEKKARAKLNRKIAVAGIIGAALLFTVTFFICNSVFSKFSLFSSNSIRNSLNALMAGLFTFGAFLIYHKDSTLGSTASDRVDRVLCHRIYGVLILLELILVFYWITVSLGYKMTDKIFPIFRFVRSLFSQLLPAEALIQEGALRGLILSGVIDGAVMILNYVPIFFCLFALVAFLEDVGYMARLAFIMDRILRKFGLHGQSTLPMILSGVIMGGCVVPGVMSTRTIRDDRARLVTILVLPFLNCMAKIPFYVLITGVFFPNIQWILLAGISVFTLIVALIAAKYLSLYVVPGKPAPFVLELPAYTMPTFRGVMTRTFERLWSFIKKVATTVTAVSVIIWFGINFPRLDSDRQKAYQAEEHSTVMNLAETLNNSYSKYFTTSKNLISYNKVEERLSILETLNFFGGENGKYAIGNRVFLENPEFAKIALKGKIELGENAESFKKFLTAYNLAHAQYTIKYEQADDFEKPLLRQSFYSYWQKQNPYFFALVRTGKIKVDGTTAIDDEARVASRYIRQTNSELKVIRAHYNKESLNASALGWLGKLIEPVTRYAGFDWRINIAILGSFAAKEALVSTLGTIYSVESSDLDSGKVLQDRLQEDSGMTALDGLAILILIALFPPCIATAIVIRTETKSTGWTLFSLLYPVFVGGLAATFVFQLGALLGF